MAVVLVWLNAIILRGDVKTFMHVHNYFMIMIWAVQKCYNLNYSGYEKRFTLIVIKSMRAGGHFLFLIISLGPVYVRSY